MPEAALWSLFLAIVQMESGGDIKARNGSAVGPAQIKPALVEDCRKWGHKVSLRDRESLEGSYRLFVLYTSRWVAARGLPDTPQTRANIWRHGPSSAYVLKGRPSAYSLKVEELLRAKSPLRGQSALRANPPLRVNPP